jgi:hypothetical protein
MAEAVATVEQMFDTIQKPANRVTTLTLPMIPRSACRLFGFSNIKDGPDKGDAFKLEKLLPVGE